jgi:hypothetical protein
VGLPPASIDFVSQVWNNFEHSVIPFLGGMAKDAVQLNRDPKEMRSSDSYQIQKEILEGIFSK